MSKQKVRIGPYVKKTLQAGESLHAIGELHWGIFVFPCIFALFGIWITKLWFGWVWPQGTIPIMKVLYLWTLIPLVQTAIAYISTESAITSQRVLLKTGLISQAVDEISISKVETLGFNQSILGRLFGFGTVSIHGTGGHGISISGLKAPMDFRKTLQSVIGA